MQLSPEQLRELGRLADQWLDSDGATRERLQRSARNNGEQFAHAFEVMVAHLEHGVAEVTVRPIPSAVLDAAVAASMLSGAIADGEHASMLSETGTSSDGTLTPPERAAGQRIGPYRLIKELGRGGMGVVWLAERADGQHTRQVALKMPLVENLNWLLAARFARERNILASLEHPGIARLYDAGVDNHNHSSQPYIAIEYVQGQPITSYVRDKKLKPEVTVQLFTKVIEAVAHAHTQLIIHRDIKPSNILVDVKGEPHLLDFGIAKLLDDEDKNAIDATQLTKLSGRALTLDYASPEQVNNASLGTASDVYSLGVVLYELLTGTRPYHPKGPTRRDLEQAILEQDPQKPSEQLLTQTTGNSETGKSARRMRGDLDTIVLKALRKDPKQRYATAQAFADDLKRYIGFEPIAARPQGLLYRASKYARRHRVALTATAAGIASIALVAGYALQQQQLAAASQGRAKAVDSLLRHLFRGMSPDVAATRTFTANELLDRTALYIDADPMLDATTRRWTSRTMADLYNSIGQYDMAIKRYIDERADAVKANDGARQVQSIIKLIETTTSGGKLELADQYLKELGQLNESKAAATTESLAYYSYHKGRIALFRDEYSEASTHFNAAVLRARDAGIASRAILADALQGDGAAMVELGNVKEALARVQEARDIFRALGDARKIDAQDAAALLGDLHNRLGHYETALALQEPLLREIEQSLDANHPVVVSTLDSIALATVRLGKFDHTREVTKRIRATLGAGVEQRQRIADFYDALVAMYSGQYEVSERLLRAVLSALPAGTTRSSGIALMLAELMLRNGHDDQAKAMLDDVERIGVREIGPRSDRVAMTRIMLACWNARRGELTKAHALVTEAAENLLRARGIDHPGYIVARTYALLFADGPRAPQHMQEASALADQLERNMKWQPGATTLAKWLREPNAVREWSRLPVVL
jgi:serine/threonine-protein kinase